MVLSRFSLYFSCHSVSSFHFLTLYRVVTLVMVYLATAGSYCMILWLFIAIVSSAQSITPYLNYSGKSELHSL